MTFFQTGDRVRSKRIGKCPSFVGTVRRSAPGGYEVRDGAGKGWLREAAELTLLASADAGAPAPAGDQP